MNRRDYKFNGTTGIIASLQLNLNVGIIAEPFTSKTYEESAVGNIFTSYPFGVKLILYFYKNYPYIEHRNITKIYILPFDYISP